MPESLIGLFPDGGGTHFLPLKNKISPALGLYLGLTGKTIRGKNVLNMGYANYYIKQENVELVKSELINKFNRDLTALSKE